MRYTALIMFEKKGLPGKTTIDKAPAVPYQRLKIKAGIIGLMPFGCRQLIVLMPLQFLSFMGLAKPSRSGYTFRSCFMNIRFHHWYLITYKNIFSWVFDGKRDGDAGSS